VFSIVFLNQRKVEAAVGILAAGLEDASPRPSTGSPAAEGRGARRRPGDCSAALAGKRDESDTVACSCTIAAIVLAMDWQHNGVKIIPADDLVPNTPQTPGMTGAAAITRARTGASKLWAGTVLVQPNADTGPHHGEPETVLYIVRGRTRTRWGGACVSRHASPGEFS
jgi:hypothetical protein